MAKRNLLKDVSVDTLLSMRDNGMTNQDIANSLDVSYRTILTLIGKQPGTLRKPYEPREVVRHPKTPDPVIVDEPEACLVVEDRNIDVAGAYGTYNISLKDKIVKINTKDPSGENSTMLIAFDKIKDFIAELSAIERKRNSFEVKTEMW